MMMMKVDVTDTVSASILLASSRNIDYLHRTCLCLRQVKLARDGFND